MDIDVFFQPVKPEQEPTADTLGKVIECYNAENQFPEITKTTKIALIGVNEWRGSVLEYTELNTADQVRKRLYGLFDHFNLAGKVVDLGNIKPGNTYQDTCYALKNSCEALLRKGVVPIVIGGSNDLLYPVYNGYEKLELTVNLACVDAGIDMVMEQQEEEVTNKNYLNKIILHQPNYLFNYSHLAYQSYYVNPNILELMTQLNFDAYRLGEIKDDMREVEPVIRDADLLSIDFSSVNNGQSSAISSGPNGLDGADICQIARYGGMSDKLSAFCLFELVARDKAYHNSAAELAAQAIWYFFDGYFNRKGDFPRGTKNDYLKYRVAVKDFENELIFFKSSKSDRWWIEVPFPSDKKNRYKRHKMIPCSYKDYILATKNEVPDRWLKAYLKLS